jgi:hypothetical protein
MPGACITGLVVRLLLSSEPMQLGATMLEVDLDSPDFNVERSIKESCSAYGRVSSVKLHREPSPFALVEMSHREQTFEVAAQFGGSAFGNSALVHLAPKTK